MSLSFDDLRCVICKRLAEEAVVASCCKAVLCETHVGDTCPACSAEGAVFTASSHVRAVVGSLPTFFRDVSLTVDPTADSLAGAFGDGAGADGPSAFHSISSVSASGSGENDKKNSHRNKDKDDKVAPAPFGKNTKAKAAGKKKGQTARSTPPPDVPGGLPSTDITATAGSTATDDANTAADPTNGGLVAAGAQAETPVAATPATTTGSVPPRLRSSSAAPLDAKTSLGDREGVAAASKGQQQREGSVADELLESESLSLSPGSPSAPSFVSPDSPRALLSSSTSTCTSNNNNITNNTRGSGRADQGFFTAVANGAGGTSLPGSGSATPTVSGKVTGTGGTFPSERSRGSAGGEAGGADGVAAAAAARGAVAVGASSDKSDREQDFELVDECGGVLTATQVSARADSSTSQRVVVTMHEHQRAIPFRGWHAPYLAGDPPQWADIAGHCVGSPTERALEPPPEDQVWATPWRVLRDCTTDEDGWMYSIAFSGARVWSPFASWTSVVRRRQWHRVAVPPGH